MTDSVMTIEPYSSFYREKARNIHIATASDRARNDLRHHDFSLWMYCDEYLDHEIAYLLFDENHEPCGYILCAEDFNRWKENMKPYIEKIKTLGEPYDKLVEHSIEGYKNLADRYPAHLHIDILESCTGNGHGTMLMNTLFERLKKDNVKGLCLGVDKENTRAVNFYKHCGFEVFSSDAFGMGMGIQF